MKLQSSTKHLFGTASVLALLASSAVTPANAQATQGLYFGGSTLASEAFRQIFDCYTGKTVGGDTFTFSAGFPGPGLLPLATTCTSAASVQGMYAGVGSGNGVRGFISNKPYEWFSGSQVTTVAADTLINTPFPAGQPPFTDSANLTNFGTYPYPRVDVGLSDSPLANVGTAANFNTVAFSFDPAINWSTPAGSLAQITLKAATAVSTYASTVYGRPIQIPAFEVNVAIPVNVNSMTVNSQVKSGGTIVQGGAIQLTAGQLCAIFSGLVTNWNSATTIPYLDAAGNQKTAPFYYANVPAATAGPYSAASLPITVVFRSDGSGTSFILTNYLHAVCPLLDSGNDFGYQSIFGALAPTNNFTDLINKIIAVRGTTGPWYTSTTVTTGAWLPRSGSNAVAAEISDTAGKAGYIGYVSSDFTKPYSTNVFGTSTPAPHAASVQNEDNRINGVEIPTSTTVLSFIAPTPISADNAWSDTRLRAPATTWTYNDYNIYSNTFTTPTVQGGVTLSGQSVLPLTNFAGAYPLSGTTFLDLYGCYNVQSDPNRVTNLRTFLSWFINNTNGAAQKVVENNGFHLLPTNYRTNINLEYLTSGSNVLRPNYIQAAGASPTNGCSVVTVSPLADGGAK